MLKEAGWEDQVIQSFEHFSLLNHLTQEARLQSLNGLEAFLGLKHLHIGPVAFLWDLDRSHPLSPVQLHECLGLFDRLKHLESLSLSPEMFDFNTLLSVANLTQIMEGVGSSPKEDSKPKDFVPSKLLRVRKGPERELLQAVLRSTLFIGGMNQEPAEMRDRLWSVGQPQEIRHLAVLSVKENVLLEQLQSMLPTAYSQVTDIHFGNSFEWRRRDQTRPWEERKAFFDQLFKAFPHLETCSLKNINRLFRFQDRQCVQDAWESNGQLKVIDPNEWIVSRPQPQKE